MAAPRTVGFADNGIGWTSPDHANRTVDTRQSRKIPHRAWA